jgi:hypothetical protein
MNLLNYTAEQLRRPFTGRQILLRMEIWTGRLWAETRSAEDAEAKRATGGHLPAAALMQKILCVQPFGSVAWCAAMRTVHGLRLGLPQVHPLKGSTRP